MTAEEMQALAPAPEGCRWESMGGEHDWCVWLYRGTGIRALVQIAHGSVAAELRLGWVGVLRARVDPPHPTPLDAILALRRLAGHLWPWPGWPVVEGVRPAGWGPRPGQEEAAAHADTVDTLGYWLRRTAAGILTAEAHYRAPTGDGMFCAIDRDGRWVEVDTRGGR